MECSFQSEGSLCSVSGKCSGILPLLACKRDMTSHLVSQLQTWTRKDSDHRITVNSESCRPDWYDK